MWAALSPTVCAQEPCFSSESEEVVRGDPHSSLGLRVTENKMVFLCQRRLKLSLIPYSSILSQKSILGLLCKPIKSPQWQYQPSKDGIKAAIIYL